MKKTWIILLIIFQSALALGAEDSSCYSYRSDLNNIGRQINTLRESGNRNAKTYLQAKADYNKALAKLSLIKGLAELSDRFRITHVEYLKTLNPIDGREEKIRTFEEKLTNAQESLHDLDTAIETFNETSDAYDEDTDLNRIRLILDGSTDKKTDNDLNDFINQLSNGENPLLGTNERQSLAQNLQQTNDLLKQYNDDKNGPKRAKLLKEISQKKKIYDKLAQHPKLQSFSNIKNVFTELASQSQLVLEDAYQANYHQQEVALVENLMAFYPRLHAMKRLNQYQNKTLNGQGIKSDDLASGSELALWEKFDNAHKKLSKAQNSKERSKAHDNLMIAAYQEMIAVMAEHDPTKDCASGDISKAGPHDLRAAFHACAAGFGDGDFKQMQEEAGQEIQHAQNVLNGFHASDEFKTMSEIKRLVSEIAIGKSCFKKEAGYTIQNYHCNVSNLNDSDATSMHLVEKTIGTVGDILFELDPKAWEKSGTGINTIAKQKELIKLCKKKKIAGQTLKDKYRLSAHACRAAKENINKFEHRNSDGKKYEPVVHDPNNPKGSTEWVPIKPWYSPSRLAPELVTGGLNNLGLWQNLDSARRSRNIWFDGLQDYVRDFVNPLYDNPASPLNQLSILNPQAAFETAPTNQRDRINFAQNFLAFGPPSNFFNRNVFPNSFFNPGFASGGQFF